MDDFQVLAERQRVMATLAALTDQYRALNHEIKRPGSRSAVSGLFISTQDHDPLDGLAAHGQRQRSLPSLALTERDYSVGLNAAKLFRSPIIRLYAAVAARRASRSDSLCPQHDREYFNPQVNNSSNRW